MLRIIACLGALVSCCQYLNAFAFVPEGRVRILSGGFLQFQDRNDAAQITASTVAKKIMRGISSRQFQSRITSDQKHDESFSKRLPFPLIPLQQVNQKLHLILDSNNNINNTVLIATEGYITNKRSFGSSLAFIDVAHGNNKINDTISSSSSPLSLQTLLKRQEYNFAEDGIESNNSMFKSMIKSLLLGTKIYIEGVASFTRNEGEVVLLIKHLEFLRVSRNPEHCRGLLQRLNQYYCFKDIKKDSAGYVSGRVGISLDDFRDDAFGPSVKLDRLRKVLIGDMDVKSLFMNSTAEEHTIISKEKRVIDFAELARLIVNNLPEDCEYPYLLLRSKGSDANKPKSDNIYTHRTRKSLPMAPANVRNAPASFIKERKCSAGSDFEPTPQYTIPDLVEETNDSAPDGMIRSLVVSGWVQNRKRFQSHGNSIAVLEIVEDYELIVSTSIKSHRLKCVLHPDCFQRGEEDNENITVLPSDAYGHLMSKGAQVLLQGYFVRTDGSRPVLWVTNARLLRISWSPKLIHHFLNLISGSKESGNFSFSIEEVASALGIEHAEASKLVDTCKVSDSTERQWRAAELSRGLQDFKSRKGQFTKAMKEVLDQNLIIRKQYPLEHIDSIDPSSDMELDVMPMKRQGYLRNSEEGSRWRSKKRPQLEWMVRQIKDVVESHPDFGTRPLNILDVGGGRGHLSNYLSIVLGNNVANVHVIDIDSRTIRNGRKDAQQKGLNVRFGEGDASCTSNVEDLLCSGEKTYDVIIALHACGALSDVALGYAVVNKAGFVIAPCCFRSNPHLQVTLPDSNLPCEGRLKEVRPSTWLGMKENEMVALAKAAEIQGDTSISSKAIHTICALRAKAVMINFRYDKNEITANIKYPIVRIKTFPIGFSTRNYVLIGKL